MSEKDDSFSLKGTPAYVQRRHVRSLRPIFWASVACIVIAVGGTFYSVLNQQASPAVATLANGGNGIPPAVVSITGAGFSPATISVQKGQEVTWLNLDERPHQPASDPYPTNTDVSGFIDKTPLNDADSYGFRFESVGTFTYHDQLNPFAYKGTVIVRP